MEEKSKEAAPAKIRQTKRRHKSAYTPTKYWWTHGAWNHHSKDCGLQVYGHQDDATFENKKDVSVESCPK